MSTDDRDENPDPPYHFEHGVPVFDTRTRLSEIEREQAEAKKRDKDYRDEQLKIDRRMVWFTGLWLSARLIVGGINGWQASIARRSAIASENSANAAQKGATAAKDGAAAAHDAAVAEGDAVTNAQDAFIAEHRPYIVMDENFPQFFQHLPAADQAIQVNIQLRNIGAAPANKVLLKLDGFILTTKLVAGLTKKEREDAREQYIKTLESKFRLLRSETETVRKEIEELEKRNISPGQDLAPKSGRLVTTQELMISKDDFPKLISGVLQIYVVGLVTYTDSSRKIYSTEMCSSYYGPATSAWHVCDSHNQIK